jgi:ribonuclease P protein component
LLPRAQRLRAARDFKRVYKSGRSIVRPALVLYVYLNRGREKRIGFSISKKIGGAVERNRIKRKLREASRSIIDQLKPGFDAVIVCRSRSKAASFEELRQILVELFTKADLCVECVSD